MTRDEATLLLKTIGRFVGARVKPLQAEIASTQSAYRRTGSQRHQICRDLPTRCPISQRRRDKPRGWNVGCNMRGAAARSAGQIGLLAVVSQVL
jgi:hypothetical protein